MRRLPTLLLGFCLLACNTPSGAAPPPATAPAPSVEPAPSVTPSTLPATGTGLCGDVPASDDVPTLVNGTNAFGLDLWKALSSDPANQGNLAIAPASLGVALGMTQLGANGATDDAIREVLHQALTGDAQLAAYQALLGSWCKPDAPYQLSVVNRLFGQENLAFVPAFVKATATAFGAPMELVDFAGAFEAARQRINAWVAEQTKDKIRDLIPPGGLDQDTRLVLTNAIYFKGQWAARFDPDRTTKGAFHAPGGDVTADMMHQMGGFPIANVDGAQILDLAYAGGDQVMTIVLPEDLAAFEKRLAETGLAPLFGRRYSGGEVHVTLPRFKLAGGTMALKPALKALGMGIAFSRGADFSGMTTEEKLKISDVFHKVFVEVNEEGTEAAAATAVVMKRETAMLPVQFNVDRPFLFFLRDAHTGAVLFMGRVVDPTA